MKGGRDEGGMVRLGGMNEGGMVIIRWKGRKWNGCNRVKGA